MTQLAAGDFLAGLFKTDRPAWLLASDPADRLASFLLALAYSTWWLGLAVILQFALGIHYKLPIYILSMILVPVVVIGAVLLVQRLKYTLGVAKDAVFYEPLLVFSGLFILLAFLTAVPVEYDIKLALAYVVTFALGNVVILWRLSSIYRRTLPAGEVPKAIRLALILASTGGVVIVGGAYLFGNLPTRSWYVSANILFPASGLLLVILPVVLYRYAYRVIPWVAGLTISLFARKYLAEMGLVLPISLAAAIVPAMLLRPRADAGVHGSRPWLEGLVIIWLALIAVNLYFPSDRLHYNAFLAHVNDVVHGKTLLVDTHPQYGLGLTYLLSAIFGLGILPLSYSAFSLLNCLLIVIQGSLLYFMLRTVVKSWWIPALAVTLAAAMNLWQVNFVSLYLPSGGPIRFLPIDVLLSAIALRLTYPRRPWSTLEYVALALCSAWGFETLVYGVVVYVAIRLFEIVIARLTVSESIARGIRLVPLILAAVILPLLAIEVGTYLRSGQWPAWQVYFDMLRYFSTVAKPYQLAISFWSEWILALGVCFGSLLLIGLKFFYASRPEDMRPYILPFGMTAWGVVQFSFYIANPNVVSNMIIPAIFLVAYWFSQIHVENLRADFAAPLAYLVYIAVLFELVSGVVSANPEINATPLALLVRPFVPGAQQAATFDLAARWSSPPQVLFFRPPDRLKNSQDGLAAIGLIERYAPGKDRIAVLIAPDSSNEALLMTHKVDIFPLGDVKDQSNSPTSNKRALEFPHHLADGDIIFSDISFSNLVPVQAEIVGRLCQEFSLHPLEVLSSGIAALKLGSTSDAAGACTCGDSRLTCPQAGQ